MMKNKNRFIVKDSDCNSDIDGLKYVLNVLYRENRDDFAEDLIERFGSVYGIFDASYEELLCVRGMTERVAIYFSLIKPLQGRVMLDMFSGVKLDNERAVVAFAVAYFAGRTQRSNVCVFLDKQSCIIDVVELGSDFRREVICGAAGYDASKVFILTFSSQSGGETMGLERLAFADSIMRPLASIGTELIDFIDYRHGMFTSLRRVLSGDYGFRSVTDSSTYGYYPDRVLEKLYVFYRTRIGEWDDDCVDAEGLAEVAANSECLRR